MTFGVITGWDDAVGGVAALVGLLSAIAVFAFKSFALAKRIDAAIGVDEEGKTLSQRVRSAIESLDSLATRVNQMESTLNPPGGASLATRLDTAESDVRTLRLRVETLIDLLRNDLTDRRRRRHDDDELEGVHDA